MKNRYWLLYFSILAAILAGCFPAPLPVSTPAGPTPTASAMQAPTATPVDTGQATPSKAAVTAGGLYVHAGPDVSSAVVPGGYLVFGDLVTVLECEGKFCKIEQPFGYVWRGCLSDNPDGLGCSAK